MAPQAREATTDVTSKLGTLGSLPSEVRGNIYSWLHSDGYQQVYRFGEGDNITYDTAQSSEEPSHLQVNETIRKEMLGGWTTNRHCSVRIEEHKLITNFAMHDTDNKNEVSGTVAFNSPSIPACKRIIVTIDSPSPRDGLKFYKMRQHIQNFIRVINAGARGVNPQVSIELDRRSGRQITRQYNDFAILFGPFVELSSRCKAVMIFRTTGLDVFMPRVESYCNLIEAAMSFNPEARDELMLHQCQIDIKTVLSLIKYNQPKIGLANISPLNNLQVQAVASAVNKLMQYYWNRDTAAPVWLIHLSHHFQVCGQPNQIPKSIYTEVMEGYNASDMRLWAAGFITTINPFFDDAKFFSVGWRAESTRGG